MAGNRLRKAFKEEIKVSLLSLEPLHFATLLSANKNK